MRSRGASRRSVHLSSSSCSSGSSSIGSSDDSSSDECAVRPADKLERLRRIFLSQPTKHDEPRARQHLSRSPRRYTRETRSPDARARSRAFESPERLRSRCDSRVISRRHADSDEEPKDNEDVIDSSTDEETAEKTRLPIDGHVHSLCEQVKRMTAQRESAASQLHTMLDQAIEELQFLKRQEERSLQCHIKQIEEVVCTCHCCWYPSQYTLTTHIPLVADWDTVQDFALRLEVFEQQYLAKVADIQREMQTAIQQQRANAETTILAAAKQLHEKTQTALLPSSSSSLAGTRASLAAMSQPRRLSLSKQPGGISDWSGEKSHRVDDFHSLSLDFGRNLPKPLRNPSQSRHDQDNAGDEADSEMSPVEKQKAKLRALEAKLASFSQGSVKRITSELKGGSGLRTISPTRQPEMASHTVSSYQSQPASRASMHTSDHQANGKSWKPTPLSPLRKNQSYWRRGISLEAKTNENDWAAAAANASGDSVNRTQKRGESVTKAPSLSSRFLLPEEEQELRHLRNSIGLAKDWMERHH